MWNLFLNSLNTHSGWGWRWRHEVFNQWFPRGSKVSKISEHQTNLFVLGVLTRLHLLGCNHLSVNKVKASSFFSWSNATYQRLQSRSPSNETFSCELFFNIIVKKLSTRWYCLCLVAFFLHECSLSLANVQWYWCYKHPFLIDAHVNNSNFN